MFHIGKERTPQHAEETGANHLILERNKCEIEGLDDWPINGAHAIRVEELVTHLQEEKKIEGSKSDFFSSNILS